jgi:GMP synthase (glutamine-hydrolysing)
MEQRYIVVLQHAACESPGAFTPSLIDRAALVTCELDEVGAEPLDRVELDAVAGIVAMGGPMGVYQVTDFPWLDPELAFIRAAVSAGVPFLGICLGAQLLAGALGASVFPGFAPEVGVLPVTLTEDGVCDPVLGGLPEAFPVLEWHSDTFGLPDGAVLLATSEAYPHQAFRVGSAYALQFHAEANWRFAANWLEIPEYRHAIQAALGPDGPARLARDLQAVEATMTTTAKRVVEAWLSTYVDRRLA